MKRGDPHNLRLRSVRFSVFLILSICRFNARVIGCRYGIGSVLGNLYPVSILILRNLRNVIPYTACGIRNADKAQVQGMVQKLLALEAVPKPDDTADALAAAVTGLAVYAST